METRTGMMPVCGAILLCTLAILSFRAWQGADLATEFRGLGIAFSSFEKIDDEIGEVRHEISSNLGLGISPLGRGFGQLDILQDLSAPVEYSDDFGFGESVESYSLRQIVELQPEILASKHSRMIIENSTIEEGKGWEFEEWFDEIVSTEPLESDIYRSVPADNLISTPVNTNSNQPSSHVVEPNQPPFESTEAPFIAPVSNNETSTLPAPRNRVSDEQQIPVEKHESAWTIPAALIDEIEDLYRNPLTSSWAHSTVQIIQNLQHLHELSDDNIAIIVEQLGKQLEQLDFLTIQLSTTDVSDASFAQGELATRMRQIRYSIERRLAIWPIVHELSKRQQSQIGSVAGHHVGQFLLASRSRLNTDGVQKGWADYLKLTDAANVFNSLNPNEFAKKKAARSVLARLFSPSLNVEQKQYLRSAIDDQTVDMLRVSAAGEVDLPQFLKRLEKLELRNQGVSQFYLNDTYQSLLWSDDPGFHELASRLQTHYRNANFRVSVSEALLNRMVPQLPDTQEPYRDRIMGAEVVGQNRISNQIQISLIPDPEQISMKLETYGKVKSRTTATRSGIVVENEGTSRFRIIKRLAFGQQGIFAYRPETTSQVAQRIIGLRSNLDNIPPLGWMARKIAQNKIAEQAPATKRYTQHQLETKAESKFEQEIEYALDELEANLTRNLLHPLIAMDLEPDPVEISTTADRINMRYRLAGRDQMAAHTPRPRGVQDCLLSMQIHESAINNTISRFELAGRKFTTQELVDYTNQTLGEGFVLDDQNARRKPARFEFAPFDPVRIEFEEQKISIVINLKSFQIGKGKRWRNLVIKSSYDPYVVSGFNIGMIQSEEGLRIKGKRLNVGDQLAIGVICEVLFPEQFQIAMMPSGIANQLKISNAQTNQFVVSKGWIGLSVDEPSGYPNHQPINNQAQQPANRGSRR